MISAIFRNLIYIPFVNILVALIVFLPGHSSAVAIIVFTILLRLVLLIPNRKALESSKKIQTLQPEINELRQQYKDDQQAQAQALMDLYAKNKISPFGSCLPLLIQLPILIILYRILQVGFTSDTLAVLYHFIPRPDVINNNFFGIDLSLPDHTYILPVLATGTQFIQSLAMMAMNRQTGQKMPGQGMMLVFPLMTLLIANQISAGAVLYWVTTTIFGIFQQVAVNRSKTKLVHASEIKVESHHHDQLAAKTKDPTNLVTKKPTGQGEQKKGKRGVQVTIRRPGQKK